MIIHFIRYFIQIGFHSAWVFLFISQWLSLSHHHSSIALDRSKCDHYVRCLKNRNNKFCLSSITSFPGAFAVLIDADRPSSSTNRSQSGKVSWMDERLFKFMGCRFISVEEYIVLNSICDSYHLSNLEQGHQHEASNNGLLS